MKKILVPTDFSENSKHALRVAAQIAAKCGATLEILHANTAVVYAPPFPEYYAAEQFAFDDYEETAVKAMFELKQELVAQPEFATLTVETRLEEGFLHSVISRVAEEDGVDLVVMGTKGATGTTEFFIGSNTEKVIRTAPCAVLAVPQNSGEFTLGTVCLASTLRSDQTSAFQSLAEWQKCYSFDVKLLYLNNPAGFDSDAEIEKAAREFEAKAGLIRLSVFSSTNTFNEESAILEFAHQNKAEMVVMGTHQRQGLSHLLFGSLTEDTVNHSDIPVLSIPLKK